MEIEELRSYDGRNIYSYGPVIRMRVNLGKWANYTTKDVPYFTEKLVCLLPGLQEHHCSRGRPGGFIERLKEGTYFGHVIEHVAIELQGLAGYPVNYGSTRGTEEEGKYNIIFAYKAKEGAIIAGNLALKLVKSLLEGKEFAVEDGVKKIQQEITCNQLGPSTKAIAAAADKRGIPYWPLGIGSLLQLGYGKKQKRVQATITSNTSCIGVDLACDKMSTKKILSQAGIPVPLGGVAKTEQEALAIAAELSGLIAIKPYNGNHGKGVSVNLAEEKQIRAAFGIAKNYSEEVIVEQSVHGKDYRLLVVGGRLVAAAERKPASIEGDGVHSVRKLLEKLNQSPLRGEGHEKPLTKIKVDSIVLMMLAKKNLTLDSIPTPGEMVYLRENGNLSTGGIPIDVIDQVHPFNAQLAVRCANILGLDVAGIDIVAPSIAEPIKDSGNGVVIEVNAAPGIRMHLPPLNKGRIDVAEVIMNSLFPPGQDGRIPIVSITGTNGKTTTTRMIGHILSLVGYQVGMTTTDGVYLDNQCIFPGDMSGPQGARMVLENPTTEIAVLETARGGIVRAGLGYDWSDVAVLTNISDDHLGQDGLEDIDDLIYVKSLVLETVKKQGYVVLNGEDPYLDEFLKYVPSEVKIIYFALRSNNLVIKKHLEKGQQAVYLKNNLVILASGKEEKILGNIRELPSTFQGKALYNVQNALAAIGSLIALGVPVEKIVPGLKNFNCNEEQNPGRSNLWEMGDFQVLLDYGHNPAGYRSVGHLIREMRPNRAVGIIGVPGDRQDKLILEVGQIAANIFQQLIIKEDKDLRGRKPLEVAQLLYQGALGVGMGPEKIKVTASEEKALELALEQAKPGDLIVIFYEKFKPLQEILKKKQLSLKEKKNANIAAKKEKTGAVVVI